MSGKEGRLRISFSYKDHLHCRVGKDTINNSQDMKMKSEMPKSLAAIEKAAESLALASSSLKSDPYSQVMNNLIIRSVNIPYFCRGEETD